MIDDALTTEAAAKVRDRVKEFRRVPAASLLENPKNFRLHPDAQRSVLRGALREVGIATAIIVRETSDGALQLIDGHLRREELGEQEVPVLVLDVTEAEADLLLATIDPLAAMAQTNQEALDDLLGSLGDHDEAIHSLLDQLGSRPPVDVDPPDAFPEVSPETIETNCQCPKCGYEWSK